MTAGKRKTIIKGLLIVAAVVLIYTGAYYLGIALNPAAQQELKESADASRLAENTQKLEAIQEMPLAESELNRVNLVQGSAMKGESCPVTFFMTDLQWIDPEMMIGMMNACHVSTLTIPLVWSFLEREEGHFDSSEYDTLLQPYAEAGFQFVFLIDGAGRQITGPNGDVIANSLPEWLFMEKGATRQRDFLDREDKGYGLSYSHPENLQLYLQFCRRVIEHFGTRYAEQLVGFAPAIMNEFEVKYPQTLYAWTDYGDEALWGFREWLRRKYNTVEELNRQLGTSFTGISTIAFPVVTYNNSQTSGALTDDPLFMDYMCYREESVIAYVTPVLREIRKNGYKSIAYFGQTLCDHDAIYASGLVTKLAAELDVAVIDYNFYDGYGESYDSMIVPLMVNYVKNAGYKEVWAGLYLERIPYLEHMDFLQETIDYIAADGLAKGYEIGGMIETFQQKGLDAAPNMIYGVTERSETPRIAIYAGKWNFYKSHGEQFRYFTYFLDALTQMYKITRFELGYAVDVLCDEAILEGKAENYELLILPTQYYVDTPVRVAIEQYLDKGGKALMDLRFGEWNAQGVNQGSWSDSCFAVGPRESLSLAEVRLEGKENSPLEGISYMLRSYFPDIPNLYAMLSTDETKAGTLMKDSVDHPIGIYSDKTIILGFQPQIQYKYTKDTAERLGAIQIIDLTIKYLLKQ